MNRHPGAPSYLRPWLVVLAALVSPCALPGASRAATPPAVPMQGVVVDAKGAPVAGAKLFWVGADPAAAHATADDGSFLLPALRGAGKLLVEAAGFLSREVDAEAGAAPLRISLRRRPSWRGRVLDAAMRAPIQGASFVLQDAGGAELARGRIGSDGRFELRDLEVRPYRLAIDAPGRIREQIGPLVPDESTGTDVLMSRAMAAAGQVVDDADKPVAGVSVLAWPGGQEAAGSLPKTECVSGADGRFSAGPLPEGRPVLLWASSPGSGSATAQLGSPAESSRLVLGQAARLAACGRRADDGSAVRAFRLRVEARDANLRRLAGLGAFPVEAGSPDDSGCATLALPAGVYRVSAGGEGLVFREIGDVNLAPGADKNLGALRLEPQALIAIRVVGTEGGPVEGAQVEVYSRQGGRARVGQSRTDASGRVNFRGLAEDRYDIEVSSGSSIPVWEEKVAAPGPEKVIRLREGATVRGDVVEADGGPPVTVFRVTVLPLAANPTQPDLRLLKLFERKGRTSGQEQGRFLLSGLPEGRFAVRVEARGYAAATVPFEVQPGRDAQIHVELRPATCATGLVLARSDPGGVSGAAVRPSRGVFGLPGEIEEPLAVTDADGRFAVCDLEPEATRQIVFDHPDFAPAGAGLRAGRSSTVILDEGAGLRGLLTGSDGDGVASWDVRVFGEGWARRTETDEDGAFELAHLPPGQATLVLSDPLSNEYADREERRVGLEPGKSAEIEISLGGVLRGRVEQAGAPLRRVPVRSIQIPGRDRPPTLLSLRRTRTDDDGRFQLPRISAGTHIVQALLGDQLVNRVVEVGPGGGEVTLRIGSVEISGITVDGDQGDVLPGVEARVMKLDPSQSAVAFAWLYPTREGLIEIQGFTVDAVSGASGTDGRFRLWVESSDPDVTVSHPQFLPDRVPIDRFLSGKLPTVPLYRGGSLTARLLAPGGAAACAGEVRLLGLGAVHSSSVQSTNAVGETRFSAVRRGAYALWGICPGTAWTRLDVPVEIEGGDQKEETLMLGLGGRLEIYLEADGRPPEDRLRLRDDQADQSLTILEPLLRSAEKQTADGVLRVILDRFPAGTFVLEDAVHGSRTIILREGEGTDLRFVD